MIRKQSFILTSLLLLVGFNLSGQTESNTNNRSRICEPNDYKSVDTLFIAFQDLQVARPMWRKIMITPKHGNWYKVAYEDSNGGMGNRRIHKHRIKKFTKQLLSVKKNFHTCSEIGITRLTIQMDQCSDHFDIPFCNGKHFDKMRQTLKIWK